MLAGTADGVYRRIPLPQPSLASLAAPGPTEVTVVLRTAEVVSREGVRTLPASELERIELRPEDVRLRLEYSLPVFVDPGSIRYQYRLRGYDPRWIDAAGDPVAVYTSVPPGSYTFEARATIAEPAPALRIAPLAVALRVVPAMHERLWFRLLATAFVFVAVLGAVEIRRRQQRHVRRIRRQIATDLHDDLSTNLSGIALAGRMVARGPGLGERERAALDRIVSTADSMGSDLRDIVWLIDPQRDTAVDVADKMRRVASGLLGELRYTIDIDSASLAQIGLSQRRQLLLMYKEALHNVVRHASARNVSIRVQRSGQRLQMQIRDDGTGFSPDEVENGLGLVGMRARAQRLGAELSIESAPGHGTTIDIVFHREAM
jgi:signal transduction histidine kinase